MERDGRRQARAYHLYCTSSAHAPQRIIGTDRRFRAALPKTADLIGPDPMVVETSEGGRNRTMEGEGRGRCLRGKKGNGGRGSGSQESPAVVGRGGAGTLQTPLHSPARASHDLVLTRDHLCSLLGLPLAMAVAVHPFRSSPTTLLFPSLPSLASIGIGEHAGTGDRIATQVWGWAPAISLSGPQS